MNILTIAAIGAGLYLLIGSKKQPSSSPKYAGSKLDKGFKIIVPCKEYEIYDEQKSAEWMYDETVKMLDFHIKKHKNFEQVGDEVISKAFGCKIGEDPKLSDNPKYYKWGFRLARAMTKAFADSKMLSEGEANAILNVFLESIKTSGLSTESLITTIEGPL